MKTSAAHILKYATQLSCILQKSHCNFVTILFFRLLARLFVNLAVCIRALISKSASIFCLVEQALWRMPFFTEWSCASSLEVILAGQSSYFPTWTSASRTLGSRCIFHILLRRRSWRRFGCVDFARLLLSCRKLQMSPFEHCLLAFHSQQYPRLLCSRCFTL